MFVPFNFVFITYVPYLIIFNVMILVHSKKFSFETSVLHISELISTPEE